MLLAHAIASFNCHVPDVGAEPHLDFSHKGPAQRHASPIGMSKHCPARRNNSIQTRTEELLKDI